ncbi:MFS transporter [Agromyces mariniharenae]|uniref:MFS transporter n=1 Tax=Agromyces mariniharenae TaxID=2604423 RepID=A0A5S4V116_9MICO|nr:MFS transporter [Agromyces mariniharenae]TYL50991.1 MFS transporter [Agromyces mariniharenae]
MSHSSTTPGPARTDAVPARREHGPRLTLVVLALAQAMLVIDLTVVNVALPVMSAELGIDPALAGWAIAAYAVPFGGLLILGGRLTDVFGARRMLLAGLSVFTAASLVAGLAPDAAWLVGARAAQGVGAALLSPAALATLLHRFQGPARNRALGVWSAIGGAGAAVGVLLGGLLAGGPGWRWIFFINLPVGVLVALAVPAVVGTAVLGARPRGRIDVAGALLATAGIAALVASFTVGEIVEPWAGVAIALGGVALLAAFVGVERRAPEPLVRLGLLRSRPVATGSLLMLVATGLLVGGFVMFSFELQVGAGWGPIPTGLAFLPIALGVVLGAQLAGHAVGSVGARPVAAVALLVGAAGLALAAVAIATGLAEGVAVAGMSVAAAGLGAGFVCASTTTLARVDHAEAGTASGVLSSSHEIGSAVGVSAFSAILASGSGVGFATAAIVAAVAALLAAVVVPSGTTMATGGAARGMH